MDGYAQKYCPHVGAQLAHHFCKIVNLEDFAWHEEQNCQRSKPAKFRSVNVRRSTHESCNKGSWKKRVYYFVTYSIIFMVAADKALHSLYTALSSVSKSPMTMPNKRLKKTIPKTLAPLIDLFMIGKLFASVSFTVSSLSKNVWY